MHMTCRPARYLLVLALSLALAPTTTASAAPAAMRHALPNPDMLPPVRQLSLSARTATQPLAASGADKRPDIADVGDVDSFGNALRWLGVTQASVVLSDACDPVLPGAADQCVVVAAPGLPTAFNFRDIARITLPRNAAESLLCHWFSPVLTMTYANPGTVPAMGQLSYSPTLTIDNPVLDDPALINAATGLPFNGSLETSMTASERFIEPLDPGAVQSVRDRDSAVCIAGFITRRALVDNFGLTAAQAKEFFKRKTTVHLNVSGSSRYVSDANLIFGLRIIGD